jgi:hypothetical protein
VDMNLRQLGRTAGERLLAAIDGHPSVGLELLPCSLVVRESSRPRVAQAATTHGMGGDAAAGPQRAPDSPGVPVPASVESPAGPLGASG